jgi:hypothetical protein
MAHFSRFIRPGYTIVGVDDAATLAAYDFEGGRLVLVYPNFATAPARLSLDLSRFTGLGGEARWYQTEIMKTSGDRLAAKGPAAIDESGRLNVEVGAGALATFIIDAAGTRTADGFSGSGVYRLRHVADGRYAAVGGDDPEKLSARMVLNEAGDGFRLDATGGGYYRMVDQASGHDVNVSRASTGSGAIVIQYWSTNADGTAANSQWLPEPAGDGTFRLRARHSGLYLDVDANGGLIQSEGGGDTQVWALERVGRNREGEQAGADHRKRH